MRPHILGDFIHAAALMTASIGSLAQAGKNPSPPLPAPQTISASPIDDSSEAGKAALLKVRAHYGHVSVFDFFSDPKFDVAARSLGLSPAPGTVRDLFGES